jgi:hypothetical protein
MEGFSRPSESSSSSSLTSSRMNPRYMLTGPFNTLSLALFAKRLTWSIHEEWRGCEGRRLEEVNAMSFLFSRLLNVPFLRFRRIQAVSSPTMASAD